MSSEPTSLRLAFVGWGAIARVNRHEIRAEGRFGDLSVILRNKPLDENPKSSAMTALNLVRCIENRLNPVII